MANMHIRIASMAVAAILFAVPAAAGELIQNGGFETGDITGWTEVGNYIPTGFNHATSSNFVGMTPYAGNYFFEFGNYTDEGSAGISQTMGTVSGQTYDLSFEWSTGGADAPGDQSYLVLWDGNVVDSISTNTGSTPWTLASLDVTGTGHDTLTIEGYRNYGYNGIDNVSVTGAVPAPEPGTLALFGIALLGLGGLRLRRKLV
jgi:hypothetical protein